MDGGNVFISCCLYPSFLQHDILHNMMEKACTHISYTHGEHKTTESGMNAVHVFLCALLGPEKQTKCKDAEWEGTHVAKVEPCSDSTFLQVNAIILCYTLTTFMSTILLFFYTYVIHEIYLRVY